MELSKWPKVETLTETTVVQKEEKTAYAVC